MRKKILIIEDDFDFSNLLRRCLKNDYELEVVHSLDEGSQMLCDETFDLCLLDIQLGIENGFELFLEKESQLNICDYIIMSSRTDLRSKLNAYRLGAVHYIEKPFELELLKVMIEQVLKRGSHNAIAKKRCIEVDSKSLVVRVKQVDVMLTPSEFKVFSLLFRRESCVVRRDEILSVLKNGEEVCDRIVDAFISSIRKKISTQKEIIIKSVYGQGYMLTFMESVE